jgi:hypothetical protein
MNMLVRIPTPAAIVREPQSSFVRVRADASEAADTFASREEAQAFTLLTRDERILILLSRTRSRLSALAVSGVSAIEALLPVLSPEAAAARKQAARLTALARFAILYRLDRSGLDFAEDARIARAGYSDVQVEAVRFLVGHFDRDWSPPRARWGKSAAFLALAGGGAWLTQLWIGAAIGDPLLAWLLAILAATASASFVAVTAHPSGSR